MRTHPLVVTLLFVILALPCCNGGFDDCHNTIYFTNNSDKPIYAVSTLKKGFLNFDPTNEEYAADFKVRPGKTIKVKIGITLQCWEQTLEQTGVTSTSTCTMPSTLKTRRPTG